MDHFGLRETGNHDRPQLDNAHTATIETKPAYDYTCLQLPVIDYWTP